MIKVMVMKMSMIVMIMIIHKIHDRSRCDSCIGMIISITNGNCHNEYDYDQITDNHSNDNNTKNDTDTHNHTNSSKRTDVSTFVQIYNRSERWVYSQ